MSNNENFSLDLDFLEEENSALTEPTEKVDIDLDSGVDPISIDTELEDTATPTVKTTEDFEDPLGLGDDGIDLSGGLPPQISLMDDVQPVNSTADTASSTQSNNFQGLKEKFLENKLYLGIAGGILLLAIIGVVAVLAMSGSSAKPTVVTPPPVQEPQKLIDDQSEESNTETTASGVVETTESESGSEVSSTSTGLVQTGVTNTETGTTVDSNDKESTNSGSALATNDTETETSVSVEKKDPSDISIPLKSVTEKIEVNSDGSLKKSSNNDIETRNVKDGSIIIDNSQNKLPNLLDLSVNGITDGQTFKISDEIKVSINGITNSLSIEPTVKGISNKDAYIIGINLAFYKDSIISSEKGTVEHTETLPLDFMKTGKKTLYVMVNGIIYKTINFNIQ